MKRKVGIDTSFIWALKGLKQVGSEEGVDYYHVVINNYGAFVVEADHNSNTIDLLLSPIVDDREDFVEDYLRARKDVVCINLEQYINQISEFLDTYKDSIVPYHGLLEMAKTSIEH